MAKNLDRRSEANKGYQREFTELVNLFPEGLLDEQQNNLGDIKARLAKEENKF